MYAPQYVLQYNYNIYIIGQVNIIVFVNKQGHMYQTAVNKTNKIDNWLSYSSLLYNHLVQSVATQLIHINSVGWLRGVVNMKSSFKFQEGFICVAGLNKNSHRNYVNEGGFSIYKCLIPTNQQLDDDRLKTIIKLRSHWNLPHQIDLIQQYGNSLQDREQNNMFALSHKKLNYVRLISTRKLLQQGVHFADQLANNVKLEGHSDQITCIKWANYENSSHKLLTSSKDSSIVQWDIQKIVLQRQFKYHRASIQAITPLFNFTMRWGEGPLIQKNSNNCIASVSLDQFMYIWDQRAAKPVAKINAKQKQLYAVDCISEHTILSGGSNSTIKLWDLRSYKEYIYSQVPNNIQGHTGKIQYIKPLRYEQHLDDKTDSICKINFMSCGEEGKIIKWKQKLEFIHEGHQGSVCLDINDQNRLSVSAEKSKKLFMIWQPGVSMCQQQISL